VNRETGNRLRQQLVDSVTGEVVESSSKGRGYEVGENQFLLVQDEELQAAQQEGRTRPFTAAPSRLPAPAPAEEEQPVRGTSALKLDETKRRERAPTIVPPPAPPRPIVENTRTIELDRFVPREQIDPRYYNTPYYIAPRDQVGLEAFAVIRDAMAGKGLVGMGRVVLANRERPIIIEPMGRGLRGITLRYAHEVRSATEFFADIPPRSCRTRWCGSPSIFWKLSRKTSTQLGSKIAIARFWSRSCARSKRKCRLDALNLCPRGRTS
jgi:DNA end-binding protein Ku